MNTRFLENEPNPLKLKSFPEHQFLPSKKAKGKYLVICLHGQGGNLLDLRKHRARLRLDEFAYLFLNAPFDCTHKDGRGGFEWHGSQPFHRKGIHSSLMRLEELLKELGGLGFRSEKILLFGFSQGGVIALEWALRGEHRFLGVVAISAWIFEPDNLLENLGPSALETPILMTHGPADEVIHYGELKERFERVSPILKNLRFDTIEKGHEIHQSEYALIRKWVHYFAPPTPISTSLGLGI